MNFSNHDGLPTAEEWQPYGITILEELRGGHQARVLRARRTDSSNPFVVKLTRNDDANDTYHRRLELLASLAEINEDTVGPLPIAGRLSIRIGAWSAAAYPFQSGTTPTITRHADVAAMAEALASLHRSMRLLPTTGLGPVAALRGLESEPGAGTPQLLHGDYASSNVILTRRGTRVLDFDDAGHGPIEFEIGNSLYMVLFDATMSGHLSVYRQFRRSFVNVYQRTADVSLAPALLDRMIQLRKHSLSRWLEDPPNAPPGIRDASPEWRERLTRFACQGLPKPS